MRVKLKSGQRLLAVPAGATGEAIAFKIREFRGTDTPDDVVFSCIFHGYPGVYQLSQYAVESIR